MKRIKKERRSNRKKVRLTRDERLQLVRQLIKQAGQITHKDLIETLAEKIGENDVPSLRATLYRDLDYLSGRFEIKKVYTDSDGVPVPEDEILEDKRKWRVVFESTSNANKFKGESHLRQQGAFLLLSKSIAYSVSVEEGTTPDPQAYSFYFAIGSVFLRIKIKTDDLPLEFIVSRVAKNDISKINFSDLERQAASKRVAALFLPIKAISGYKAAKKLGNTVISLMPGNVFAVRDCSSTNGTFATTCSNGLSRDFIEKGFAHQKKQQLEEDARTHRVGHKDEKEAFIDEWLKRQNSSLEFQSITTSKVTFKIPSVLQCSKDFTLMLTSQ